MSVVAHDEHERERERDLYDFVWYQEHYFFTPFYEFLGWEKKGLYASAGRAALQVPPNK